MYTSSQFFKKHFCLFVTRIAKSFIVLSVNLLKAKPESLNAAHCFYSTVETRMVGSELNIFSNIIGAFINNCLAD